MRILIIGHNQIIPHNRSRWLRLAELYPDADVTVVPPRYWHNESYGKIVHFEVEPEAENNYQVCPVDVFFPGTGRYLYRSFDLGLRRLKPDIIWVYFDAQGYVMQQVLLYRRMYAPKAKVICCTSTNIPVPLDRFDQRWRYRFALRNIDAFSTGTNEVVDKLRAEGIHHPILHRVVTGADEQHWHPGDEAGLKRQLGLSDFVVGFVGRHESAKGLPDLVSALEQLEGDWSFLSLGEGPFKDEAERRLKATGRSVFFQGYIPRDQTPPYYRCMDVLVVASRQEGQVRDPSPVVIMEAGLSGVVVIGSDLAGIPELVGETGFVIAQGNVTQLRERLSHLMSHSELRIQLAKQAHERAVRLFASSSIARDTYQFFQDLLAED